MRPDDHSPEPKPKTPTPKAGTAPKPPTTRTPARTGSATGGGRPASDHAAASAAVQPLTQQQLHDLLIKAGAKPAEAELLSAVGMAESGGLPTAYNTTDPHGGSYGLWQINGANNTDHKYLADPLNNAKEAVRVLRDQGITAWGSYTDGRYRQFLDGSNAFRSVAAITDSPARTSAPAQTGSVKAILDMGVGLRGTPYVWGGTDPKTGLDCSGLVQYVYGQNGVTLPRTAAEQAQAGMQVAAKDAQPGDLVAFDNSKDRAGIDHIGIYLGNGLMLQSPHTGANVQVVKVNLAGATTIRRVVTGADSYAGLKGTSGKYAYTTTVDKGGVAPTGITAGNGGGDVGNATLPGDPGLPADATPAQIKAQVAKQYGYLSAFLNQPEIGPILMRAALGGWDKPTLQGALFNTKWWKTTSDTARQWDAQNLTDHASAKAAVDQQMAVLGAQAAKAGITIDPFRLHEIAVNSLRLGLAPQQISDALLSEGHLDLTGSKPSDALSTQQALKQTAAQYHIDLSDATLNKWTQDVVAGKSTQQGFDAYIKQQAKSLYPWMADHIDQGGTVEQWADPYREKAASLLELDPKSIDFNHPKFSRALTQVDPATGQRGPMSLSAWDTYLRSLPEYNKTRQATDQAAQFAQSLTQQFAKASY